MSIEGEEMYKSYEALKLKRLIVRQQHGELFGINLRIKMIQYCLRLMTADEKRFIDLRYFRGQSMAEISLAMAWSEREVYRIRQSVLAKTQGMLHLGGDDGLLDTGNQKA